MSSRPPRVLVALATTLALTGVFAAPVSAAVTIAPVTGLSARLITTGDGVVLTWTASTSHATTGVTVRRTAGTVAPTGPTAGSAVADVAATVVTVSDRRLPVPRNFAYAVFAHDAAGHVSLAATVTMSTVFTPALQGTVTATDGGVVAHATVTAVPAAGGTTLSAVTDDHGHYLLTNAQGAAAYAVCVDPAQARGAPASGYVARCAPTTTTVVAGQVVTVRDVVLQSGAAVFGTVVSATTGSPAGGATVAAFAVGSTPPAATTRTADDGTFRLVGLPVAAAGYLVCVDGSANGTGGAVAGMTPGCAGGAAWGGAGTAPPTSGATLFKGRSGAVTRAVIVPLHPWNVLHGAITETYSGDGIANLAVTAWSAGTVVATGTTDGNGAFAVKVRDGSYAVCFDAGAAGWNSQDIQAPAGFADHCAGTDAWYDHSRPAPGAQSFALGGGQSADASAVRHAAGGFAPVDGLRDATVAGDTVYLFTADGRLARTSVVDSGGYWEVDRLAAGNYLICLDVTGDPSRPGGYCIANTFDFPFGGLRPVPWDAGTDPATVPFVQPYALGWGAVNYVQVLF